MKQNVTMSIVEFQTKSLAQKLYSLMVIISVKFATSVLLKMKHNNYRLPILTMP